MNVHLKGNFWAEFTAYEGDVIKEVALTSFTLYDAHCSFARHWRQIRLRVEYLLPTDTVIDWHFYFWQKNLAHQLTLHTIYR